MHWIYLIHKFHNLSWITWVDLIYISLLIIFCIIEYVTDKRTMTLNYWNNELFHNILIYWDAPICHVCRTLVCLFCIILMLKVTTSSKAKCSRYFLDAASPCGALFIQIGSFHYLSICMGCPVEKFCAFSRLFTWQMVHSPPSSLKHLSSSTYTPAFLC